jgi:hypothetical protein
MISKKDIKNLNKNGFIVIKNFIKKKNINNIFQQLDEILTFILKKNKIYVSKDTSLDEKYLTIIKKKYKLKSHFYDAIKYLESVNSVIFSNRTLETFKKFFNNKNILITGQRLRLDHALDRHHLPLHQELNNISYDFLNLWCPLIKVNKGTGSLCVLPGSHKYKHVIYKDSHLEAVRHKVGIVENILNGQEKEDYHNKIIKNIFKKNNIYFPDLNPGDALIFKTFTFHGSTPFMGKGIRWTLLATFHPYNTIPYLTNENFKDIRIPYNINYNKFF